MEDAGSVASSSVALSIVHPMDPWAQGIGGFDTCIDGILRTAPRDWRIELIGVTVDPSDRPVGRWLTVSFDGRPLRFFGVLHDPEPDAVRSIPLSLRFALASRRRRITPSGRIVQFHRFESAYAVALRPWQRSVYFLHNDPRDVGTRHSDVRWRRLHGLFMRLLRARLAGASAVVCVDPRTPAWVEVQIPSLNGSVISQQQWSDPEIFRASSWEARQRERRALRTRLGLDPTTKIVIFAGRLERQKDPDLLVDAFAETASRMPDIALLLVGKGRLQRGLEARADRLGLGRRFHLLAPLPRAELAAIYRAADVAACTSGFESGPRHVFEALACGVPVVSFDVGQVRGVLEKDPILGHLVVERDPSSFSLALTQVLDRGSSSDVVQRRAAAVAHLRPQAALAPIYDRYEVWLNGSGPEALGAP